MKLLSRAIFREILSGALLGTILFTFVLFLQRVGRLFELLVRSAAPLHSIGYLLVLVLPSTLALTIPLGVLVGVLLTLSRMSSDGEILAMRASGIPGRRIIIPVLAFGILATAVAAYSSVVLTPRSVRETVRVLNAVIASQVTAEIQPRVFEEQFPNAVLYVGDVIPSDPVRWRQMFLADLTPPDQRKIGAGKNGEGPRITLASEVVAVPDVAHHRIQLSLFRGSSHEAGKLPDEYYNTSYPRGDQAVDAPSPAERRAKEYTDVDTLPLMETAHNEIEARIELHRRLALPVACLVLALAGLPLGVSSRKSGKSSAFVVTVFLALVYYMGLISMIGLAQERKLPVAVAVWAPNVVFAVAGMVFFLLLERPGDRDILGHIQSGARRFYRSLRRLVTRKVIAAPAPFRKIRLVFLPQIIDTYIVNSFLYYFTVWLGAFVAMVEVFTFFELLSDIVRNGIPLSKVLSYLFFLTPMLIYDSAPMAVLVATLVTFGILAKHNEIIALKASGVSVHRLALPLLVTCAFVSTGLFAFDYYIVPGANRIQDALRNEIKGRPVQTYLRPDRKWIMGENNKVYYYRYFDPDEHVMGEVNVYEIDSKSFRLTRHIRAERARWEPSLKTWVFFNGWVRNINGIQNTYRSFTDGTATFRETNEPPSYFLKEVKTDSQMNHRELASYIHELQQSGFETVRLRVQYQKKFSTPLFALIMALISIPFAFLTGSRGAMAGVAVSFGIAISYLVVNKLFEQVGNVGQLPTIMAAWSPDGIFALAGVYLLTRMRT